MTTEPKFIPEEAVEVNIGGNATFRVRMIDCVGYIVPSAECPDDHHDSVYRGSGIDSQQY